MVFQFEPIIQAGIRSGVYETVRDTATGQLLGIARNKATGQFVAHAVGLTTEATGLVSPLFAPAQLVVGGLQMVQTHLGFKKTYKMLDALQHSVGVLQATTVVIGLGTVAGVTLSAVNLRQTLKLREDIKQLRLEVKEGFIDMKHALKEHGSEISRHIDTVAKDIKFEQHRLVLIRAYGQFRQATDLIKTALLIPDSHTRNATLVIAQLMLSHALADYSNPHLLAQTCAAGQLRRLECAWAIDQAITLTFQLQNAFSAVSDRIAHLQAKIRQNILSLIEQCETEDELDFLFPEVVRIHEHDLAVLNCWQNHVNWLHSLPSSELELLQSADFSSSEITDAPDETADITADSLPSELSRYEKLKQKSHFVSLRDQLKFMLKPDLRRGHEAYVSQQATASGYKALAPSNWQGIPDLTVANLYWYFKDKQEALA